MSYELAFDEDGEPIDVPPHVVGWRVRRALDGRGRPQLVHDKGKPLIIRVAATHAELLAAAGPGRYRLEAVDEHRRSVDGVPVACTGPLVLNGQEPREPSEDEAHDAFYGSAGRQVVTIEDALIRAMNTNTRALETMVGQVGQVLSGASDLLRAAHWAGITTRQPPPLPLPLPPPSAPPANDNESEPSDDEGEDEDGAPEPPPEAPPFGLPDVVKLFVSELADKLASLVVDKVVSGSLSGLPLGALLDWRKAAPTAVQTESTAPTAATVPTSAAHAPAAPTPTAPVAHAPAAATAASVDAPSASAASVQSSATAAPHASVSTAAAGAAAAGATPIPNAPSPLGVAPAETTTIASAAPRTHEELAAAINAHFLQVWRGLSAQERAHATQLIARLSDRERTGWFSELAGLTVPEAIARARAFLENQSATPPPTT